MPSFRFTFADDTSPTQWYDEIHADGRSPGNAPVVMQKLRAANPEAVISIERDNGEAKDLNPKPEPEK